MQSTKTGILWAMLTIVLILASTAFAVLLSERTAMLKDIQDLQKRTAKRYSENDGVQNERLSALEVAVEAQRATEDKHFTGLSKAIEEDKDDLDILRSKVDKLAPLILEAANNLNTFLMPDDEVESR